MVPNALFDALRAPWLAPYWAGLARHELRLPSCANCGRWEWYPQGERSACHDSPFDWRAVNGPATLFTYTRVTRPLLPGIDEPYLTGLIELADVPARRIAARIVAGGETVRIGAPATLTFSGEGAETFPYFVVEDIP